MVYSLRSSASKLLLPAPCHKSVAAQSPLHNLVQAFTCARCLVQASHVPCPSQRACKRFIFLSYGRNRFAWREKWLRSPVALRPWTSTQSSGKCSAPLVACSERWNHPTALNSCHGGAGNRSPRSCGDPSFSWHSQPPSAAWLMQGHPPSAFFLFYREYLARGGCSGLTSFPALCNQLDSSVTRDGEKNGVGGARCGGFGVLASSPAVLGSAACHATRRTRLVSGCRQERR